jgi:hypothetical protein
MAQEIIAAHEVSLNAERAQGQGDIYTSGPRGRGGHSPGLSV